ncbi:MAG: phosphate-starvation-inducible PsiE family protein [Gammaproteobacteria bacterium]|nr:phosphate-starvation-inducible PsiE family protein [Gammaproteobacteria bacterium]MDH3405551.1 phosphate-starvation-inducible PsiE family protein [Gammaproteobacteria bacterium]MDH3562444.1 phosphate-starvation-inducible PsiE family protein [Gammaproteobacteria bacterium]MDH5485994.1 phosphate-starvation-inducible PsiE family protein [Gammaproteobacteria bacterium]
MLRRPKRYASLSLRVVENAGLLVIAVATVIAGVQEVNVMIAASRVTLADLLLMFIYLEVLTMVGLYFESGKLPVRIPLYIGMVALARYMVLEMKEMDVWRLFAVSGAILVLALAVLAIRYGHVRFPYPEDDLTPEKQMQGRVRHR